MVGPGGHTPLPANKAMEEPLPPQRKKMEKSFQNIFMVPTLSKMCILLLTSLAMSPRARSRCYDNYE